MSTICSFERDGQRYFFAWSHSSDRPCSGLMTRGEFEAFYVQQKIQEAKQEVRDRLDRASQTGTSSLRDSSLADICFLNRAGPEESQLPVKDSEIEYHRGHSTNHGGTPTPEMRCKVCGSRYNQHDVKDHAFESERDI